MNRINKEEALAGVGGDVELLTELAGLFLEEYPGLLDAIRTGLDRPDAGAIVAAAHQLKGLLAQFAAEHARSAAYRIEMAGREKNIEAARTDFALLETLMAELKPSFEQLAGGA